MCSVKDISGKKLSDFYSRINKIYKSEILKMKSIESNTEGQNVNGEVDI